MRAPQIQSVERLSSLIFADRISGDERGLAFPGPLFSRSALAHGADESDRPAFRVPEKRTANQPLEATGGSALGWSLRRSVLPCPGTAACLSLVVRRWFHMP